jgi:hypothetical protein
MASNSDADKTRPFLPYWKARSSITDIPIDSVRATMGRDGCGNGVLMLLRTIKPAIDTARSRMFRMKLDGPT